MRWRPDQLMPRATAPDASASAKKVLRFPDARHIATREGETALELVNQAAEVIMSIEAQAAEAEIRARNTIRDASEKLQLAENRIQSLQAEQRAAEQSMQEANARTQQVEAALKEAQSRTSALEAELYAMEQRVKIAEGRANGTQQTLARVEEAIRTKLLDLRTTTIRSRISAA
jgi:hypothetical protein